jgi:membrane protein
VKLRRAIVALRSFLRRDLWLHQPKHRPRRTLYHLLRMGVLTIEGAIRSEVFLLSAALTYKVAFALVPFVAVVLALYKGFGGFEKLFADLKQNVLPYLAPQGQEFVDGINAFVGRIDAAALGGIGFLLLLYTSLSLMHTTEDAFNRIWGIKSARTIMRRFTVYWTLLTISPIVLVVSLALSTFVQNHALYLWLTQHVPVFGKLAMSAFSFAFAWGLFTTAYVVLPSTRVRVGAALAGALVAGTAWELLKSGYIWYNSHIVPAYQFYGSMGAIPVFLLWIYLSWVVALFGAEVAFAAQHVGTYRREVQVVRISPAERERLALVVCVRVARPFTEGGPPPTAEGIAAALDAPVRVVHEVVAQLVAQQILREVALSHRKDPGLLPARDPARLTAAQVVAAIRAFGDRCALPDGREKEEVYGLIERAEARALDALGGVTLKALADAAARGEPAAPAAWPAPEPGRADATSG